MEKIAKILIGAFVVVIIVAVLFRGEITGRAAIRCSVKPDITSIRAIGDSVSVNWEDTSTYLGQAKYEILLFKPEKEGTYDFKLPIKSDVTARPFYSFTKLDEGKYRVKVRARNSDICTAMYTSYTTSEEVETITS